MPQAICRYMGLALVIAAFFSVFTAGSSRAAPPAWFSGGEVLSYNVSYKMGFFDISAGQAEIRYAPEAKGAGYTLTSRVWNLDGVRGLIQMRDRITAVGVHTPEEAFLSQSYNLRLNENDYRADKLVTFDREGAKVSYKNRRAPHEPPHVQTLKLNARDLFSALYSLRMSVVAPTPGKVYTLPILELDRAMTLNVKVIGQERVDTPAGSFDALHVQPVSTGGPKGRTKDKLHIWVSNDDRRMPLRIELRMALGAFTGELAGYCGLDAPSRAPKDLPLTGEINMKREALPHANPL